MNNGDRLIVLYHMDLGAFSNGTLLRLPIAAGQQTGTFNGSLSNVRMSTTEAVSQKCANATFEVTVKTPEPSVMLGDLTGDGKVSITDVVMIIDVIAGIITDANQRAAADVNGDGSVTITDCVAAIDLIAAQQTAGARRMTNTAAKSKLDGFINTALQKKMLMVDRMKSKKQNVK
jgi:hypothetical protein